MPPACALVCVVALARPVLAEPLGPTAALGTSTSPGPSAALGTSWQSMPGYFRVPVVAAAEPD